ncbi:hypothetical protein WMY93_029836 [Mugilogobius chulae]|uniref:Uncharacterized protein n=1 Tax=Mugilogobius chulae TaxID=88201 RepID=A0AAW0MW33_9GOBI
MDVQFVLHICMLESIISMTKALSDHLQCTELDLAAAIDLVFAVVDALGDKRSAEAWAQIWECASNMCEMLGINMHPPENYLRNKSGDARTSNLGLMTISAGRTKQLDVEVVIDRFAANHNNRRIVFCECFNSHWKHVERRGEKRRKNDGMKSEKGQRKRAETEDISEESWRTQERRRKNEEEELKEGRAKTEDCLRHNNILS